MDWIAELLALRSPTIGRRRACLGREKKLWRHDYLHRKVICQVDSPTRKTGTIHSSSHANAFLDFSKDILCILQIYACTRQRKYRCYFKVSTLHTTILCISRSHSFAWFLTVYDCTYVLGRKHCGEGKKIKESFFQVQGSQKSICK